MTTLIPTGCALVAYHSCTSPVEGGFTNRNNSAKVVTDPQRGSVLEALFRKGMKGGTGPALVGHTTGKAATVYCAFYLKLSDNWQGHKSGVNKVTHDWINGSNRLYLSATGVGYGPLKPQIRLQSVPGGSRNLNTKLSILRGVWYRWETVLTQTSAYLYIDGQLASGASGINYGGGVWEKIDWNPTWGGKYDVLVADQTMRIDDFSIYAK